MSGGLLRTANSTWAQQVASQCRIAFRPPSCARWHWPTVVLWDKYQESQSSWSAKHQRPQLGLCQCISCFIRCLCTSIMLQAPILKQCPKSLIIGTSKTRARVFMIHVGCANSRYWQVQWLQSVLPMHVPSSSQFLELCMLKQVSSACF